MISFVKGKAADMTETSVILENHGIGYEIFMTGNDLSRIHMGEEYKIHTYFQVREDAMVLFGFLQKDDLSMFRLVTKEDNVITKITAPPIPAAVFVVLDTPRNAQSPRNWLSTTLLTSAALTMIKSISFMILCLPSHCTWYCRRQHIRRRIRNRNYLDRFPALQHQS